MLLQWVSRHDHVGSMHYDGPRIQCMTCGQRWRLDTQLLSMLPEPYGGSWPAVLALVGKVDGEFWRRGSVPRMVHYLRLLGQHVPGADAGGEAFMAVVESEAQVRRLAERALRLAQAA